VGGSISGLCAAIALRGVGCDVEVYERTPGAMTSRGAGIVVRDDLLGLLRQNGALDLPATFCQYRRYLLPDGGDGATSVLPLKLTSWEAIYRTLRSVFPEERYHTGTTVTGFSQAGGRVLVRFKDRPEIATDILVCADGSRSEMRRQLLPEAEASYSGYVAWRGTIEEEGAPPEMIRFFDQSFTLCPGRSGGHILCYLIPGPGAATEVGQRRLNWVWYVNVPDNRQLKELLTDRNGQLHEASVPAGMIPDALVADVRSTAARDLHPRFGELVQSTPEPFIQIIVDVSVPRMAVARACLVGDAAFVLRPHAALSTAKAAVDATTLAAAVAAHPDNPEAALRAWEARQLEYGRRLVRQGIAVGKRTVEYQEGAGPFIPILRDMPERFDGISPPEAAGNDLATA
jgi:2-polyprenyl-6-methoxyphenol hydroxylase-like FAD-dependent oxidoreductase